MRAAVIEGDLSGIAYCGAGVGLLSELLGAAAVQGLVEGVEAIKPS